MKIRVKDKAFYNDQIVKVGDIIDIKEKDAPSWAEPVKKSDKTKEPEKKQENQNVQNDEKKTETVVNTEGTETKEPEQDAADSEVYLELLINEALEKNIFVQNSEAKTVADQIKELEIALGYKKENA